MGAQSSRFPRIDKSSENGENSRLKFGASSMQGYRVDMEDVYVAVPGLDDTTSFFGVYDGHGGKAVARFCAKYLHLQIKKYESESGDDLVTSVRKAFLRMDEMMKGQRGWRELALLGDGMEKFNAQIEDLMSCLKLQFNRDGDTWAIEEGPHSDFIGPQYGSTACVAIIRDKQLIVANAGDCRCVISRKGQALPLSRDHKPELKDETLRILHAGGYIRHGRVNDTLNITRAIGDMAHKFNVNLPAEMQAITSNPEIETVELCDDDDFLIIACDGVWDCISNQDLVNHVKKYIKTEKRLSVICANVLDMCIYGLCSPIGNRIARDNLTMMIVQFKKQNGRPMRT